jgi:hypothetical protein
LPWSAFNGQGLARGIYRAKRANRRLHARRARHQATTLAAPALATPWPLRSTITDNRPDTPCAVAVSPALLALRCPSAAPRGPIISSDSSDNSRKRNQAFRLYAAPLRVRLHSAHSRLGSSCHIASARVKIYNSRLGIKVSGTCGVETVHCLYKLWVAGTTGLSNCFVLSL